MTPAEIRMWAYRTYEEERLNVPEWGLILALADAIEQTVSDHPHPCHHDKCAICKTLDKVKSLRL